MKTHIRSHAASVTLAAALAIGLAGCQSSPKSPALTNAATASESIQHAADGIMAARQQVNVTTASLRNLVDRPQDIPAQYKVMTDQFAKLKDDAAKISAAADKMRTKGDVYLAEWSKQIATIENPELKNAAFGRRDETSAKLQEIFSHYQTVKAAYIPYQNSIRDIQTVLASDLSSKGLQIAKPYVDKATADSEPLKASLDALARSFREAGLSLQPGG